MPPEDGESRRGASPQQAVPRCCRSAWKALLRAPRPGETYDTAVGVLTGGVPFDWGPVLRQQKVYVWSCWTYALAGMAQVALSPAASQRLLGWWWWRSEGAALMLMSCISYCSDVAGVDGIGVVHVADRVLAPGLSAAFVYKLWLLRESMGALQRALGVLAFGSAGFCFLMKRRAVRLRDVRRYASWTTLWHLSFPLFGCGWFLSVLYPAWPEHP